MKAITLVDAALHRFAAEAQMRPMVILLPVPLFKRFVAEQAAVSILDEIAPGGEGEEWTDVRVVEHDGIQEIEVY